MMYTVGEMAKLLRIPTSTLRYYDKEGLLPFVERSPGGMRMFKEEDYEWLQVIHCLKQTGMPLKEIRTFIGMAMQGDETIEARLRLFQNRRDAVRAQLAQMQETLHMLEFKCWYYEMAKAAGTTAVPRNLSTEEIPEAYREVKDKLKHLPVNEMV